MARLHDELIKLRLGTQKSKQINSVDPDVTSLLVQMTHKLTELTQEISKLKSVGAVQPQQRHFENGSHPRSNFQNTRTTNGLIRCSNYTVFWMILVANFSTQFLK